MEQKVDRQRQVISLKIKTHFLAGGGRGALSSAVSIVPVLCGPTIPEAPFFKLNIHKPT